MIHSQRVLSVCCLAGLLCAQQQDRAPESAKPSESSPPVHKEASPDRDRDEAADLLRELEATLEQIGRAHIQVVNVRKIVDVIDQGEVKASDKEIVKTNQYVRKSLAKDFRELRARARSVVSQVDTVVLPRQRGVATKLRTRWELEGELTTKSKIAKLLSEHEQAMVETQDQIQRLNKNIESLTGALQILEDQLSYLDLVEESIGLSRQVSQQLKELNQEIDRVVTTLLEKEVRR